MEIDRRDLSSARTADPDATTFTARLRAWRPTIASIWQPVAMVAVVGVIGGLALTLARGQIDARTGLQDAFGARIGLTARFATAYDADVQARERSVAARRLGGAHPSRAEFEAVIEDFGFETGALLDSAGRVIQIYPAKDSLIGVDMSAVYPHLAVAVDGTPAISNVVISAVDHLAVVAYAMPFETAYGRRVFSGAFDVSRTPLSAHLHNALRSAGGEVYLIDAVGAVVASSLASTPIVGTLAEVDPEMADASAGATAGRYRRDGVDRWFTTSDVAGSPYRLVASVPETSLYEQLVGPTEWVPWVVIAAFAIGALYTVRVLFALHRSREDYLVLARIDPLTGVSNRRELSFQADRLLDIARQRNQPLAVLMVDLDRFKSINDSHGHEAGDEVLRVVTARMRHALRVDDLLGRWGGEEFVAILPRTTTTQALLVAERLRAAISATPIMILTDQARTVTASVGCAVTVNEAGDIVIGRADRAMYRAKASGNAVVMASESG